MSVRLLLCFCCLAFQFGFAARQPVTIDDVWKAHRPEAIHPVWSPDGLSFVYEQAEKVYRWDSSSKKPKLWFALADLEKSADGGDTSSVVPANKQAPWQNRRVSEEKYQWFPDGRRLLVSANDRLFIVEASGAAHRVALKDNIVAEDPKLSPDGTRVLYRYAANLFVLQLGSGETKQLTEDGTRTLWNGQLDWVYPEELDLSTAAWWSPDGKQIAYLQFDIANEFEYPQVDLLHLRAIAEPERYPQAGTANASVRVGVVAADGGATVWMHTESGPNILLPRVAWLADGSKLAVESAPRVQNALDLTFYNPQDGTGRQIIHEQSKTWLNIADNLLFLKKSPEFLWTSERSGFRHIYRYGLDGILHSQLTSGSWEVSKLLAANETNRTVLYTSSENTPLETHLYSVKLDGGERKLLTRPDADHNLEGNAQGSLYLDRFSDVEHPPQTILRGTTEKLQVVLAKADDHLQKSFDLQPVSIVKVPASDGSILFAKLIKPAGFRSGTRYPAIVEVYGGPGAQSVRNSWHGLDMAQAFAAKGYVVWQLDNRGSFGRGHAFEAPIYHELGREEVADQVTGVKYLVGLGFVDPKRVGVTGWSYGGYMTLHCLLFAPQTFSVGVAGAPVTDWHNYDTIYTERYMGLPDENAEGYRKSSNVLHAGQLTGKLLIEHNIEDDNVLFQNTMEMVKALEEEHKQYVMQIYPGKTHGVTGTVNKTLLQATLDFFDGNLR